VLVGVLAPKDEGSESTQQASIVVQLASNKPLDDGSCTAKAGEEKIYDGDLGWWQRTILCRHDGKCCQWVIEIGLHFNAASSLLIYAQAKAKELTESLYVRLGT
jgi:hypothetical protein